jgi:hypothetical protein
MIFQIDQKFYDSLSAPARSQLYSDIILHGHYVDCAYGVRLKFYEDIDSNGSSIQKDMVKNDPSLKLPTLFKQYLTTIDVNTVDSRQLSTLINRPALLLVENEVNETVVYRDIIRKYAKRDRNFKSLFEKLNETVMNEDLDFDQAGGCTQLAPMYQSHDSGKYHNTAKWKICILADRDTKCATENLDDNKKSLIAFTCGKAINTLNDNDIYNLAQTPVIWHLWYFREIENYFPAKQYLSIGLDPSKVEKSPQDWHYKDLSTIPSYDKKKLKDLTKGMTYEDYEDGLHVFQLPGGTLSEIQLFLLKLVRII